MTDTTVIATPTCPADVDTGIAAGIVGPSRDTDRAFHIISSGRPLSAVALATAQELHNAVLEHGYIVHLYYGSTTFNDHDNLRCVDVMTSSATKLDGTRLSLDEQHALGDWIAGYLTLHATRLRLNWLIWWRRIYRNQNTNRGHGWDQYDGSPSPHTNHVHYEIAAGTYRPLKFDWYVVNVSPGVDSRGRPHTLYGLSKAGRARTERRRGFPLKIVRTERRFGRLNGVTEYGTYYAMQYLKKGKKL